MQSVSQIEPPSKRVLQMQSVNQCFSKQQRECRVEFTELPTDKSNEWVESTGKAMRVTSSREDKRDNGIESTVISSPREESGNNEVKFTGISSPREEERDETVESTTTEVMVSRDSIMTAENQVEVIKTDTVSESNSVNSSADEYRDKSAAEM